MKHDEMHTLLCIDSWEAMYKWQTPKKVAGWPYKSPHIAVVISAMFTVATFLFITGILSRVSTENLYEVTKHPGVEKCRLVDLLSELGYMWTILFTLLPSV